MSDGGAILYQSCDRARIQVRETSGTVWQSHG